MTDTNIQSSPNPPLSVVVVIVSDTTDSRRDASHLANCIEALSHQIDSPPVEIIVPYLPPVEGIEDLGARFPHVSLVPVDDLKTFTGKGGGREHHDELRARGLALARGDIIGLLEDHARPDSHWCSRMIEAHSQRYAAYAGVGGAIENGIDRALSWAVYFCDFGKYGNPVPEGDSHFVSDANVSYKRSALDSIRPVWQDVFHETAVNWALTSQGEKLALSAEIVVFQHRSNLRLGSALRERFIWGRSYAGTRCNLVGLAKRSMYAILSPILPGVLLVRIAANAIRKGRGAGVILRALPLTFLLTMGWALGELVGYLTARAHNSSSPLEEANPPPKNDQLSGNLVGS